MTPSGEHLTVQQAFDRAVALHQQGQLPEAEGLYRAVLEANADHIAALHNLASIISTQRARAGEAEALLRRALARQPNSTVALCGLGNTLQAMGRFEEAKLCFQRALAIDPNLPEAEHNCGNALLSLGRHGEAIDRYRRAMAIRPGYAEAHYHTGYALQAQDRQQEALSWYEKAIALKPDYADALNNLGNALRALGRDDEAIARYEQAIRARRDYAEAYINLASAFLQLNRPEEAIRHSRALIGIRPDFAEAHHTLGRALQALNRHHEAIAAYRHATALNPAHFEAHWHEGQVRLALGDLPEGWRQWEYRLLMPSSKRREFPRPQWLGDTDLAGKRVFLYAEPGEGFGDTIQFARYAPLVARRGATVALEVQAPLAPLLGGMAGVSRVSVAGEPPPEFDYHCPLMSLPFAFKTTLASIPAEVPYLAPPRDRVDHWGARLESGGAPRIGIAWSGRPRQGEFRNRPIPLSLMASLLATPGLRFVALQKDLREGDAALLQSYPAVVNLGPELEDFADTAAIISLLDLVISVDTSVAHLAGALGKPVWILLQYAADWRWLLERHDNPWYPSARLFRQQRIGDWESVIPRVHEALRSVVPGVAHRI
jgi:tetratricopeptide (TPR) repeat protein